METFILL